MAAIKNTTILNKRSDKANATPSSDDLTYGEIAIGYKKDQEAIYIKNNEDEIVPFITQKAVVTALNAIPKFWTGTREEYNAIEPKDSNTFYFIEEEEE